MQLSEIIYQVIFYAFAALLVSSAFIVAFSRNIVHSAFALLLTFFGVAGLYVFLAAEFIAAAQVLIYVGGILVLILFAVMLTNKITDVNLSNPTTSPVVAAPLVLVIFIGLLYVIFTTNWQVSPELFSADTKKIGESLMGGYLLVFEVAGVLLLAALLGAAFLARPSNRKGREE